MKILPKKIFDWAIIGGGTIFRVVLRLRRMKKNFELGQIFFFFFFICEPFMYMSHY